MFGPKTQEVFALVAHLMCDEMALQDRIQKDPDFQKRMWQLYSGPWTPKVHNFLFEIAISDYAIDHIAHTQSAQVSLRALYAKANKGWYYFFMAEPTKSQVKEFWGLYLQLLSSPIKCWPNCIEISQQAQGYIDQLEAALATQEIAG